VDALSKPSRGEPALAQVRACLDEAACLPGLPAAELETLRMRAAADVFNLVAVGEFKRGKSSVLNALLGVDILPVGVVPLTAIATIVSHGEREGVEVVFGNGEARAIAARELADYVTEKGNPHNTKGVREVHVTWPSPWLARGVRIIDTPGIGSAYRHNSEVTYRFLPDADAVLFLLSADQPAGQAETEFLEQVRAYAGRIFFLLNKADLLTANELAESVEFASRVITECTGRQVPIFPVSARLALEGVRSNDRDLLSRSHFPAFTAALEHFLSEGKGNALAAALAKRLLRLVAQARLNRELEISSLRTPLEELRRKLDVFDSKRTEVAQERRDFTVLLEAEVRRLADETVSGDVEAFRMQLGGEVDAVLEAHFRTTRQLPSRELAAGLERAAVDAVRTAWDRFRYEEDERIGTEYQGLCRRFGARIDATVDELYRFSSELFCVPFEAIGADIDWQSQTGFYYKFWNEPPALQTLATSLLLALPKILGDSLILRRGLGYGRELADTQAGRVRYHFARRLDRSMRDFRAAMLERLDATLTGIEAAVHKGLQSGAEGSVRADRRAAELDRELESLAGLAARLQALAALEQPA
jgi:GTP-binding protein EngB required for normal cell division